MSRAAEVPLPYGRTLRLVGRHGRVAMQTLDAGGRPGPALVVPAESALAVARALVRAARAAGRRCRYCGGPLPGGRGRYCSPACRRVGTHPGWVHGPRET